MVGAGIHHSDRTLWAAVAGEEWGQQEGFHLPQSGRSTQRRQHGPRGTQSGGGSEGGARERWSDDYDTAFYNRRKKMETDRRRKDEKKRNETNSLDKKMSLKVRVKVITKENFWI